MLIGDSRCMSPTAVVTEPAAMRAAPARPPTRPAPVATHQPAGRPTSARQWWVDAAGVATLASLLVVVALWVANRGLQNMADGPWGAASSLGRLTGLVSADLLLIQVLLIARIPPVERAFGQDRLARWHRLVGFTSFTLMLVHILLSTVGSAETIAPAVLGHFWELVTTYPGMLLATAATVALIMVVVTSVRAARRRLRYESWHLLHLYAYLGVGLALPHELWTGTEFIASPAAQAYWWTLYGVAAGSVIAFRLGLPLWRSLRHQLTVEAVVPETPGVVSVYVRGRHLDRLPARSGQFFQWRFLAGAGWSRAHPYSLSAPPTKDRLRITVKSLGDDSAKVAALRPGTRVLIEGPYGALTGEHYRGGGVTMLACGVGITPVTALLHDLPYGQGQAHLIYRAHNKSDFTFRDEITRLAESRGLQAVLLPGRRSTKRNSWQPARTPYPDDADALRRLVPDIAHHDVFICGPGPWMSAARTAALAAGVPADRIHFEQFAW